MNLLKMKNLIIDKFENTENTTHYQQDIHKWLPHVLLFSLLFTLTNYLHLFRQTDSSQDKNYMFWYSIVVVFIIQALRWGFIFIVTKEKNASLIAFSVGYISFICIHIIVHLTAPLNRFYQDSMYSILGIVPFLVFAYLTHSKRIGLFLLAAGLVLSFLDAENLSNVFHSLLPYDVSDFFTYELYSTNSSTFRPISLLSIFYRLCSYFAILSALLSLLRYIYVYTFEYQDRFLDFSNKHNNFYVFLVLFCSKIYLFCLITGIVQTLNYYLNKGNVIENETILAIISLIIYLTKTLAALYVVLWNYRKTMLEWYFERGQIPSFGYWFIHTPFLGTIILLFKAIFDKEKINVSQRITNLNNAHHHNYSKIIATIIIVLQLFYLLSFVNSGLNEILVVAIVLNIILTIIYFVSIPGYKLNVYLNLLGILVIGATSLLSIQVIPFLIYSLSMLYLQLGIFHIEEFSYLPVLNEAYSIDAIPTPIDENTVSDEAGI